VDSNASPRSTKPHIVGQRRSPPCSWRLQELTRQLLRRGWRPKFSGQRPWRGRGWSSLGGGYGGWWSELPLWLRLWGMDVGAPAAAAGARQGEGSGGCLHPFGRSARNFLRWEQRIHRALMDDFSLVRGRRTGYEWRGNFRRLALKGSLRLIL
jgi:hypothetical protein